MSAPNIRTTFGALLLGALFASTLSGISNLQTVNYYRSYKRDPLHIKALVFGVWLLDNVHTAFLWSGVWYYFVDNYGNPDKIDHIPWFIALIVILTALITVFVHCFLAHRIFLLSKRNLFMTIPVLVLTIFRLVCASVTTSKMLNYQSFELLKLRARWIFTLGLAVSSAVDVLIAGLLVYLFRSNRTELGRFNDVLDKLLLYGLESGSLTCVGTVISMLCWIIIPQNLIFLGLYFVIGKLYANSLFLTLNTRNSIREQSACLCEQDNPVLFLKPRRMTVARQYSVSTPPTKIQPDCLEVNVQTQTNVHYDASSISSSK